MTAVVIIEAVVIVLLAILVGGLLKSHAEILRQLHALGANEDGTVLSAIGARPRTTGFEQAPSTEIAGTTLAGDSVNLSLEHGRGNTLLAFLSSGCTTCRTFWKELNGSVELPTPDTRTVIVTKGPESESPAKVEDLAPGDIPLVMSDETWDTFRVPMTPYFMLVDGAGMVIGEGAANNWKHLLGLLRQSSADAQSPVHLNTENRAEFTDNRLRSSGVEPGDKSLYENPVDTK